MSNKVQITLAADDKSMQQALDKMQSQVDQLERKMEKLGKTGRRGMENTTSATEKATRSIMGMASGYLTLGTLAAGAFKEIEKLHKLQEESRKAIVEPAIAIRQAKFAFQTDQTMTQANFEQELKALAGRRDVSTETAAQVVEFASSAKGSLTNKDVFAAAEKGLELFPGDTQQAAFTASRMLGISKVAGTTDMRIAAGFIQNLGLASHGVNMQAIGQHLVPVINQAGAFGDTQEQAGEIGAALSQLLQDDEMRLTSTAMTQLQDKLMSFDIARDKKGLLTVEDHAGQFVVPDSQLERLRAADDTQARMEVMRKSPELMRAFESQPGFEAKTRQAILSLVRGDEAAMRKLQAARPTVRGTLTPEDRAFQIEMSQERLQFLNSGDSAALSGTNRRSQSDREQFFIANTPAARSAAARKVFAEAVGAVDLPGLDWTRQPSEMMHLTAREKFPGLFEKGGKLPEDPAIEQLRKLHTDMMMLGHDATPIFDAINNLREQQQDFVKQRDPQMEEQTQVLKELRDETRRSNGAPRQTERPASRLSRGSN